MVAINNLKGTKVKDGKVVHKEKLKDGMYFCVILRYEPSYTGSNSAYIVHSSRIELEACIATGANLTWSNGVTSVLEPAIITSEYKLDVPKEEILTKGGHVVYPRFMRQDGGNYIYAWEINVAKEDLLKHALK